MKTSVVLVNFGGPRSLDEVPRFLTALMKRPVSPAIERGAIARYSAIGGGSPLASITEDQARLLQQGSEELFSVRAAFGFSHPSIEETIDECCASGTERIAFLVMSPFYSSRTVGVYMNLVEGYRQRAACRPAIVFIHSWYRYPLFIESWVNRIKEQAMPHGAFYIFSAHSLPEALAREPYKLQVEETAKAVAAGLGITESTYAVGWQSAPAGKGEPWIGPATEAVMDTLAGKYTDLIEVPLGFVSDHLETLYDIDIVHRRHAMGMGLRFHRVPSLNTYPSFIEALRALVEKYLGLAS
jgi:protoporphyrin/coproporphyrin ferrochelatase